MDYKLKLMQILECFGAMEGTWYENWWSDYGITKEEQKIINEEFEKYDKKQ